MIRYNQVKGNELNKKKRLQPLPTKTTSFSKNNSSMYIDVFYYSHFFSKSQLQKIPNLKQD